MKCSTSHAAGLQPMPTFSTPLELAGACNIRDIGGYPAAGGATVRRGRLFRGDSPHRLTPADLDVIGGLSLRTVIDLRSPDEIAVLGEAPLGPLGVRTVHVPMRYAPGSQQVLKSMTDTATPTLADLYRGFLDHSGPALAEIVTLAADAGQGPLLFHCLAGKDRTGVVAALLLTLLDVPDDSVAADYAATDPVLGRLRQLNAPDRERLGLPSPREANRALYGAQAATMHAFLRTLREEYGGAARYLTSSGATPDTLDRLRHLLVPAQAASA